MSTQPNELAQAIAAHQYADWRDLRFEPLTLSLVGKELAKLAVQIRDALERVNTETEKDSKTPTVKKPRRRRSRTPKESLDSAGDTSKEIATSEEETVTEVADATQGPSSKSEPPTRVVDPMHRGDHVTISEAIKAASPGDRILVRPGFYQEGLVIDKPLEIIGDGNIDEIVIQGQNESAILFKTTLGRVANLTLQQLAGDEKRYCVDIAQGRLDLEDCDITSQNSACVSIHGGADPRLRRNRIHDGKQAGVLVIRNGQGTLEDNDIFGNAFSGVAIGIGGNPTLHRNRIHDSKQVGVNFFDSGQGTLEDNDIFGNAFSGVAISEGGSPVLRRNRINRNGHEAVWVSDQGGGTFEDNDLSDNERGPWDISEDSEANVKRSGNTE